MAGSASCFRYRRADSGCRNAVPLGQEAPSVLTLFISCLQQAHGVGEEQLLENLDAMPWMVMRALAIREGYMEYCTR